MEIKKRIYLTLIIFAFLIVLATVFIVFPVFGRIKNSSEELIIQKQRLNSLEFKAENFEKFRDSYSNIEYFLKEIDNLFVDSRIPIEFIGFLEKISEESQVKIEILPGADKKIKEGFWPFFSFQIVSTGRFSDFLKFLEKLENSLYLVELESITISNLQEDKEDSLSGVKANLSIRVFVK